MQILRVMRCAALFAMICAALLAMRCAALLAMLCAVLYIIVTRNVLLREFDLRPAPQQLHQLLRGCRY